MSRIVVLAPNWIGDAVMALPAIASVRQWQPGAHLAVAARASVAPLFAMVSGVDAVVTLRGRGGWGDAWRTSIDARSLAAGRYDAALLMPNSLHAALLARRAGIGQRWGYSTDFRSRLLTRAVPKPRGLIHQAEYYLQLVRVLGAPRAPMVAELRVTEDDRRRAVELLREQGWDGAALVAFAPGAAFGLAKRWPPERMAAAAAALAQRLHVTPVLIGAGADRSATKAVAREYTRERGADAPIIDVAGRTELSTLVALFGMCTGAVSNDSGAMHLAAASGIPVTAIFGPTNEQRTSPLPHPSGAGTVIVAGRAWCRPCELRACPLDHRCMTSIEVQTVIEATARNIELRHRSRDHRA
jgi:lipopolysaccharide heptosyltransferase II